MTLVIRIGLHARVEKFFIQQNIGSITKHHL